MAGVGGSRTRRWGLQREGTRVTWREVGGFLKGTTGHGGRLRGRRGLRTVETVRGEEGWRTAGRATLEICLGTEMGQLSSVHLTGLGCLVTREKDSGLYKKWIEIRFIIIVSLESTEVRGH